jgi:hypothetical protein
MSNTQRSRALEAQAALVQLMDKAGVQMVMVDPSESPLVANDALVHGLMGLGFGAITVPAAPVPQEASRKVSPSKREVVWAFKMDLIASVKLEKDGDHNSTKATGSKFGMEMLVGPERQSEHRNAELGDMTRDIAVRVEGGLEAKRGTLPSKSWAKLMTKKGNIRKNGATWLGRRISPVGAVLKIRATNIEIR